MLKKNLSAETIRSSCCPDSKLKVPELQELQVEQIAEPLGKFAKNIISSIKGERENRKTKFDYKTKGMMAEIGKRTGVATILGFKLHGFVAWWLWRTYYLGNLPTIKKKLKVMGDWTSDLISKPDVAMIKRSDIESSFDNTQKPSSSNLKKTESR